MDFSRRSFLQGAAAASIGFLFSKRLERVLGELEAEALAEAPVVAGQMPSAAVITCMPQMAFRPERLIISGAGSGASAWMIDDVKIGDEAQFVEGGIPGDFFSATAVDTAVNFSAAIPGCEIQLRVRYVGDKPEGEPFYAAMIGRGLDGQGRACRVALPINSGSVAIVNQSHAFPV